MRLPQRLALGGVWLFCILSAGCSEKVVQARGFVLPDGDPDNGQAVFVALQCQQCHTVRGVELEADTSMREGPVVVELGGSVTKVKTYGELVTSIIHPSENIVFPNSELSKPDGSSWMTNYNGVMTVQQLIDLVAFLQPKYKLVPAVFVPP